MHDVFISYSAKDKSAADAVCHALERVGIRCWVAPRDMQVGKDWSEAILEAIGNAKIFLLILSENSSASRQVRNEVLAAVNDNVTVVPLRIAEVYPEGLLKLQLSGTHWLDAFPPPLDTHLHALSEKLATVLAAQAPPRTIDPPPASMGRPTDEPQRSRDEEKIQPAAPWKVMVERSWVKKLVPALISIVLMAIVVIFFAEEAAQEQPTPQQTHAPVKEQDPEIPDSVRDCDQLASSPFDADHPSGSTGVVIEKIDFSRAIPACERAVKESSLPRIELELARSYEAAKQFASATRFYKLAADHGNPLAQNNLGSSYLSGDGVEKSEPLAFEYYKRSADQGFAMAQYNLGTLYEAGRGVSQSYEEAARLFKSASDQGLARAESELARLYLDGHGVPKSPVQAVALFKAAADQGSALAQTYLGTLYEEGTGVDQSDSQAAQYYRLAADQGDAVGQYLLGNSYMNGKGVPQSDAEAARLFKLAGDQGMSSALVNLGYEYQHGKGVPLSDAEAVRLYKLAADQGNDMGQFNLGLCYEFARGVEKSVVEAQRLYKLSAAQGNELAQKALTRLEQAP